MQYTSPSFTGNTKSIAQTNWAPKQLITCEVSHKAFYKTLKYVEILQFIFIWLLQNLKLFFFILVYSEACCVHCWLNKATRDMRELILSVDNKVEARDHLQIVKHHIALWKRTPGEGILQPRGITVSAQLDGGGGMKRTSTVPLYTTIAVWKWLLKWFDATFC